MVAPNEPAILAATPPSSSSPGSPAEHIYIGSEDTTTNPAAAARTLRESIVLRNRLRRTGAEVALYAEGFAKVTELNGGNSEEPFFLDLRFIDPVPQLERVVAVRCLAAALACGALTALAAFLMRFDALYAYAAPALAGTALATITALYVGLYLSHEKIRFSTLHGRVVVFELVASFGAVKTFRALVPILSRAVEEAAERIGTDTAAYLRAEMREHYRLRGAGVIDNGACAEGTGRILAQFDVQL